jgi:ribosome-binding protein aMBF1 (putative translation factor)
MATKTKSRRKTLVSPIGQPVDEAARRRRGKSRAYAAEAARLAPYEAIARLVIKYRLEHDLTQKQLAARIGTSHSAISRLESGQATISLKTMKRIAEALGGRLVVGIELESEGEAVRELIAI